MKTGKARDLKKDLEEKEQENKKVKLTICLTKEQHKTLKIAAIDQDKSMTDLIIEYINQL